MKNLFYLLTFLVFYSCSNTASYNYEDNQLSDSYRPPEVYTPPYQSSITKENRQYQIDTNVIKHNINLFTLLEELDSSDLTRVENEEAFPKFLTSTLKKITQREMIFARPNEEWSAGCIIGSLYDFDGNLIMKELPQRQIVFAEKNNEYLFASYQTGGFALTQTALIVKFDKKDIVDFWIGGSYAHPNKDTIVHHIKEKIYEPNNILGSL